MAGKKRILVEQTIAIDARGRRSRSVTVNFAEGPLGWLRARGLVSDRQFQAGERLRRDWTLAGLSPRVTMRWDDAPRGSRTAEGAGDATLAQLDAKRRFDAAIADAGSGLSDILWRVACNGDGLESAELALGWPKRSAKLVLLIALDRLAEHYRIG